MTYRSFTQPCPTCQGFCYVTHRWREQVCPTCDGQGYYLAELCIQTGEFKYLDPSGNLVSDYDRKAVEKAFEVLSLRDADEVASILLEVSA